MSERTKQILFAVDTMLTTHDTWENDPTSPAQPTEALELAIENAISVGENGDIPSECRDLCLALSKLGFEWDEYRSGRRQTADFRPLPHFWGAFRSVMNARELAEPVAMKRPEPVKNLRQQGVTYNQIAFHIWGYKNEGPFITPAKQPDIAKIEDEVANPGKHTADWIHPEQVIRQRDRQRELSRRLSQVSHRETKDERTPEKATILQMLGENQYPDVIAKVKGVTVEEVLKVAQENKITPNVRPNLASMRAPQEPQLPAERLNVATFDEESETTATNVDEFGAIEEPQKTEAELVAELNDGKRGVAEIVSAMKEQGREVTYEAVQKLMSPKRRGRPAKAKTDALV